MDKIPIPKGEGFAAWLSYLMSSHVAQLEELCGTFNGVESSAAQFAVTPIADYRAEVEDDLLHALHSRVRSSACEEQLWAYVIPTLGRPLPAPIAHDLIDRGVALRELAHSSQVPEVVTRLAASHDEAALTLGKKLYTDPLVSATEFLEFIQQHGDNGWLLSSLVRQQSPSRDKREALLEVVRLNPRSSELLHTYDLRRRAERASDPDVGDQEIGALFATQDPHVLRALAANPNTPTNLLRELMALKSTKLARAIRIAAKNTLQKRGEQV